jgi:hypothetical protein
MKYNLLNAVIYEVLRRLCEYKPSLRWNSIVKMAMTHCFPDWVEWRTEMTMEEVDKQTEVLKKQWREEENAEILQKFQDAYPEAKVTTHDPITGAVLIEHPPDGSKAQDLLGGAMEIRSPWSLPKEK